MQSGLLARRQLNDLGFDSDRVHSQIVAGRWAARSVSVVSTFTGPLTREHVGWLGVLHAGGDAILGGVSAAALDGLLHWERPEVCVLVRAPLTVDPVPGVVFTRTRRPLSLLRKPGKGVPRSRLEPAALMFAAADRSTRTAQAILAAVVQQRLSTAEQLRSWLDRLKPLRHAALLRRALDEISGGAQSLSEIDVARLCLRFGLARPARQRRRLDRLGRRRFTDCEWDLPDGRVVVLEVDGAFHMDVEHWEDDIARHRSLSRPDRIIVRCTSRELRDDPFQVFVDLAALGVPKRRVPHDGL